MDDKCPGNMLKYHYHLYTGIKGTDMPDYFNVNIQDDKIMGISSLGLAHLGDGVYELLVRTWLCLGGKSTSKGLHRAAVSHVSATAQAKAADRMAYHLSDEEQDVFRRGRNAKVNSVPKNANLIDYHMATGLESLFGYLYLKGRTERINELFAIAMSD